ncbi:uncharacterized protein LOC143782155 [Ranitomeya variabilis]|uniref:uncharacterized protein LOC143782155 n=1 Tax=Ranitomeya variabilis TaxID=490064 RepID=UPI004056268F
MPKFIHLSSVFQNGLKALGDRLESGLAHINTLFQDVIQCLNRLEADLQRPAHDVFNKIEQGMSEHLTPELQLNVMQACNAAYVQAMQHTRYLQQPQVVFPPVPPITHFTSILSSTAYHCTATTMPSPAAHHYTTTLPGAAESHSSTMPSPVPARPSTSTTMAVDQNARPSSATTMVVQQTARSFTATTMAVPQPARPSQSTTMPVPDPTTPTLPRRRRSHQPSHGKPKKKRATRTVIIPPPSPPNVSVLSSLSLPSNVSLPSHASTPNVSTTILELPDHTNLLGPSPGTPSSSITKPILPAPHPPSP